MDTLSSDRHQSVHARCLVCGMDNERGLRLKFDPCPDGAVRSSFHCPPGLEGYDGILHGGIISTLLDGAMTNCLFARGIKALTVDLKVRFMLPVDTGNAIQLRAWIQRNIFRFYLLEAQLTQSGAVKARGAGKFLTMHTAQRKEPLSNETSLNL